MQQRVGLARALACDPSILLMDEAFSALDPIIRTEMQSELLRLQQIKRRTIVFISHDLDEAMRIGDRVAIMKDGHVVQVGTPEEILRKPANDYVRNFVRGVDAAAVFKASDIARKSQIVVSESPTRLARRRCRCWKSRTALCLRRQSAAQVPRRGLGRFAAQCAGRPWARWAWRAYLPDVQTINAEEPVAGLFGQVAQLPYAVPVVANDGSFRGAISKTTLLKFLDRDTPAIAEQQQKGQA
jgi:glycine betaine/proline transport system ATP-binding protein